MRQTRTKMDNFDQQFGTFAHFSRSRVKLEFWIDRRNYEFDQFEQLEPEKTNFRFVTRVSDSVHFSDLDVSVRGIAIFVHAGHLVAK